MKITKQWLDTHDWMLRTSNNGKSYDNFAWQSKGRWTVAPDWDNKPECGNGLHGIGEEAYKYGLNPMSRIELCETRGERIVIDGNKIKVNKARIVACNTEIPREAFLRCGIKLAKDGDTITPVDGDFFIILSGKVKIVDQSGGDCWVYGHATVTNTNQSGGDCWVYDTYGYAILTNTNQSGGYCWVYGHATLVNTKW